MISKIGSSHGGDRLETIRRLVAHAAHLLPQQGPIGVFIHHNTLHAFQHLPFEQAVVAASNIYHTEPYMSEEAYRRALGEGRIRVEDIDAVLSAEENNEENNEAWPGMRRRVLRRGLLVPGLRDFKPETIQWDIEQAGLLDSEAARSLFNICVEHTPAEEPAARPPLRPRDGVHALTGADIDDIVNSWLIRLSAVFSDQGLSYWPMPNREAGFLTAALTLLNQPFCFLPAELKSLPQRSRELAGPGVAAEETVRRALEALGLTESEWESTIQAELLALGGWAGIMSRLEQEPELAPHEAVPARLMDYLAVRMLLTLCAVDSRLPDTTAWKTQPVRSSEDASFRRLASAATLFDAARRLGASGDRIAALRHELDSFDGLERRRILHLAYERRHERQILLPLQEHRRRSAAPRFDRPESDKPSAQVFFCIDEREESIRRHLEEAAPKIETFGAAGFFGAAMNYTGIDDAHGVALCPVVVKPRHAIKERPAEGHWEAYASRARLRRLWAWTMREWSVSSRTMLRGWLAVTVLGVFSVVPMAARVLSPRRYAHVIGWLNASILPEPRTELAFERQDAEGDAVMSGLLQGFTVEEKIDRVAGVLTQAGLRQGMARLVVILGHGSTSLNNPHESAHDCGACGGRRGGPNARLFAAMANHHQVRAGLRDRGIVLPDDTWFVGGYHDTCNDDVVLFDLEDVPQTHRQDLLQLRASLDTARARSAHERARRFESSNWPETPLKGLHHVQARAEHLAEPRPEYGHCTNAVCIVGRRSSTRGLFLDRRAFLVSYDMAQDPGNQSLAAVLGAVIPVCGGINLEYYFSFVDNERYGCGTKLPHNVTGLVGVMNGYESDLRTGLPLQMVEIHEPVRILFVIESAPERIVETIRANPLLWEFLEKHWIRLAAMAPDSGAMQVYRDGAWEGVDGDDEKLGKAPSSVEWYKGRAEHLGMARIESQMGAATR
jgi:uncharacterized protein YbcC (UPF0753/DUF2309 family)